jgi:hypothetical protein
VVKSVPRPDPSSVRSCLGRRARDDVIHLFSSSLMPPKNKLERLSLKPFASLVFVGKVADYVSGACYRLAA